MNIKKSKRPIGQLQTDPHNPRSLNKEKYKKLKSSIEAFPEMLSVRPLVVADGYVVGGNMRLLALKELGYREVEVIDVSDWTKAQRDEFMIKDNLSFGDWDYDLLANEWNIDDLTEWGMDLWDTEPEEIKGLTDEDDIPEAPEEPITKLGDVWILGEHRLMCGDSTKVEDVEKLMNGNKADMVFTDPPYNVGFKGQELSNTTKDGVKVLNHKGSNTKHEAIENDAIEDSEFISFLKAVLLNIKKHNKGGWYFTFCDLKLDLLLVPLKEMGFIWKSIIIWNKNQATLSGKDYKSRYEPIVYGCPNKSFYGERYKQEDVWEFQRTLKNDLHPTMKPIPLIEKAISNSSKKGMVVLDLFLGSGSTLIASEKTHRICYGMELDPKYCDVIVKRWEDFTGKKAHLEEEDDLMIIAQAH